ncbi:MAG: NAD(P)H-dependent oxidoreductase [Rhizobiaceae bacterium]|nr:NAD(P)H-dependent oxidoreductase [Rhizobiaceae bacterium]
MSKPKIALVIGSVRPNRFADKPAAWFKELADQRDDLDFEIVDLKDYPLPHFDEVASSLYAPSKSEVAQRWQKLVDSYDGFVFTAAEYSRGPTGVLKNALDYAYAEWNRKPVSFIGYGGVGGARAVEQLRLHAIELQMVPTRNAVHIVWGDMAQVASGAKTLAELEHLNAAAKGTLDELAWWAKLLKTARAEDAAAKVAKAA